MTLASSPKRPTSGRKRRVAGWTLIMTGVAIAATAFVSFLTTGSWSVNSTSGWINIDAECIQIVWNTRNSDIISFLGYRTADDGFFWLPQPGDSRPISTAVLAIRVDPWPIGGPLERVEVIFAVWPTVFGALGVGCFLAFWGRMGDRAQHGVCLACRYDRAGLASETPCPECGTSLRVEAREGVLPPGH